jgi:hypothetical protein
MLGGRRATKVGALGFVTLLLFARLARAEDEPPRSRLPDEGDIGFGFVDAFVSRTSLPRQPANGSNAPRHLAGLGVPGDPAWLAGVGLGIEYRKNVFTHRLLDVRYSYALSGASGTAIANGSSIDAKASQPHVFEIGWGLPIPGLQLVSREQGMKFGFHFSYGVARSWSTVTMREPNGKVSLSDSRTLTPYARIELELCRRVGPGVPDKTVLWACLTAQPYLYFGDDTLAGASFGMRLAF